MAEPMASRIEPRKSLNDTAIENGKNFFNQVNTNMAEPTASRNEQYESLNYSLRRI